MKIIASFINSSKVLSIARRFIDLTLFCQNEKGISWLSGNVCCKSVFPKRLNGNTCISIEGSSKPNDNGSLRNVEFVTLQTDGRMPRRKVEK